MDVLWILLCVDIPKAPLKSPAWVDKYSFMNYILQMKLLLKTFIIYGVFLCAWAKNDTFTIHSADMLSPVSVHPQFLRGAIKKNVDFGEHTRQFSTTFRNDLLLHTPGYLVRFVPFPYEVLILISQVSISSDEALSASSMESAMIGFHTSSMPYARVHAFGIDHSGRLIILNPQSNQPKLFTARITKVFNHESQNTFELDLQTTSGATNGTLEWEKPLFNTSETTQMPATFSAYQVSNMLSDLKGVDAHDLGPYWYLLSPGTKQRVEEKASLDNEHFRKLIHSFRRGFQIKINIRAILKVPEITGVMSLSEKYANLPTEIKSMPNILRISPQNKSHDHSEELGLLPVSLVDIEMFEAWKAVEGLPPLSLTVLPEEFISKITKQHGISIYKSFVHSMNILEKPGDSDSMIHPVLRGLSEIFTLLPLRTTRLSGIKQLVLNSRESPYSNLYKGTLSLGTSLENCHISVIMGHILYQLGKGIALGLDNEPVLSAKLTYLYEHINKTYDANDPMIVPFQFSRQDSLIHQSEGLRQFISDWNVVYVTQGNKLRKRIHKMPYHTKAFWVQFYHLMKIHIYDGREFNEDKISEFQMLSFDIPDKKPHLPGHMTAVFPFTVSA